MSHPVDVVLQFEHAINSHHPDAIIALMTADGEFIDSLGATLKGTEKLCAAWAGYFKMLPDYSISHTEILQMETRWRSLARRRGPWRPMER